MSELPFRLLLITNRKLTHSRPLISVLEQALLAGLKAVQLREKDLSALQLYQFGLQLKQLCLTYEATCLINERFDIAAAVDADGVHLTSNGMPADVVRKHISNNKLIGVSTHSLREAQLAQQNGSDYILFGPVFQTPEKRKYGSPQGLKKLQEVTERVQIPVVAVGGITPDNSRLCLEQGATGVAVISAILTSLNLENTLLEFKRYLGKL